MENIEPIELRMQADKNRQSSTDIVHEDDSTYWILNNTIRHCQETYESLLQAGIARECARMVLPMATQTTLYMTGAIRNWIHFLELRDDSHAQKEAQIIAKEIKKIFNEQFPIVAKAKGWV